MDKAREILRRALQDGSWVFQRGAYLCAGVGPFPGKPETLLDGGTILKDSRSVISGLDRDKRFFIKCYRKNGFWRTLKRAVQFPRSHRCLAAALRLRKLGVDTPAVLLASRYCLITEILPSGTVFLPERPELATEALSLLADLHDNGIRHGDVSLRNIYRTRDGKLGLIDLDGARLFAGAAPAKTRFLELARLISSYLKCVHAAPDEQTAVTKKFADEYRTHSGHDFSGAALSAQVHYLISRKHR